MIEKLRDELQCHYFYLHLDIWNLEEAKLDIKTELKEKDCI